MGNLDKSWVVSGIEKLANYFIFKAIYYSEVLLAPYSDEFFSIGCGMGALWVGEE